MLTEREKKRSLLQQGRATQQRVKRSISNLSFGGLQTRGIEWSRNREIPITGTRDIRDLCELKRRAPNLLKSG